MTRNPCGVVVWYHSLARLGCYGDGGEHSEIFGLTEMSGEVPS
ncbi:hypothetical protein PN462_06335 [Spirulina sp. CS-785/01]|nr:hypothetical protein [Spirulina sp. CS-785/01]MDB9312712.1 hypothetical protein [Spirulina sp. CS-785/01]